MKNIIVLLVLLVPSTHSFGFAVKSAKINKAKSTITYSMTHPLHKWSGMSKQVDGVLQYDNESRKILKVAILTKVSSFDSKNSNRDSHMLEATESIKYPTVSFVSTNIEDDGGANVTVKGIVTFHGVPKEVELICQKQWSSKSIICKGSFHVLLTDFKIERPSLMMIKTDDEVNLNFVAEFSL